MANKRMMLLLSCFAVCSMILGQDSVQSQEKATIRRLTVLEAVKIAQNGNFDVQIADAEKGVASGDLTKSGSVFLPHVSLSETFVSTNDPLNVFGLKLKQERVMMADFDPMILNGPSSFQSFSTKAELRQPIFNLDGFFGRHAASRGLEAANYRLIRTRNAVELQVKLGYFGLVLARQSLTVIKQALATAKA